MDPRITPAILENFWNKVEKLANESGCWIFTGGWCSSGYGNFAPYRGAQWLAHRFAAIVSGILKDGDSRDVCHKCDTRCCVNPNHLFMGTDKDNARDKMQKWRHPHGEGHHAATINDDLVLKIRKEYSGRRGEIKEIARRHGLPKGTVRNVVRRLTWVHL